MKRALTMRALMKRTLARLRAPEQRAARTAREPHRARTADAAPRDAAAALGARAARSAAARLPAGRPAPAPLLRARSLRPAGPARRAGRRGAPLVAAARGRAGHRRALPRG